MTPEQIQAVVERALSRVAPEANLAKLSPEVDLREELDLDSMDFLSFVTALHAQLHVDIPEADYHEISTLRGAVSYLSSRAVV